MCLSVLAITGQALERVDRLALPLAVLVGLGLGVNPPVTVELMVTHTDVDQPGLAMGMRLTANRVAQIVQPLQFDALAAPSPSCRPDSWCPACCSAG